VIEDDYDEEYDDDKECGENDNFSLGGAQSSGKANWSPSNFAF
jgi:hypothetical protein